jgi:hypothetical protein
MLLAHQEMVFARNVTNIRYTRARVGEIFIFGFYLSNFYFWQFENLLKFLKVLKPKNYFNIFFLGGSMYTISHQVRTVFINDYAAAYDTYIALQKAQEYKYEVCFITSRHHIKKIIKEKIKVFIARDR